MLITGVGAIEFKNGKTLDSCISNTVIGGMNSHLTDIDESGCAGWQKNVGF